MKRLYQDKIDVARWLDEAADCAQKYKYIY